MKRLFTSFILCISFSLLVACNHQIVENPNSFKETSLTPKENIPYDFIPRTYHIVSVGDSLTQGVGDSTKRGGYVPYLQEQLEEQKGIKEAIFHNFGVSGNRTSQILNRLRTKEIRTAVKEADIVLITTGGNDIMKVVRENFSGLDMKDFDRELIHYEKTLTSVMDTIKQENEEAIIGLIGLYNPFFLFLADVKEMDMVIEKWNHVSENVLRKYDRTLFVEIADLFKDSVEDLLYSDYFHPNDKGYELMANQVFHVLQNEAVGQKLVAVKKENEQDD
ncbi:SGNH/GDSL hydrolase family protein [Robertmurraya sp. DFI.2.37]|jgi:lysophospholipase L1-like esterase|uniref:SGNH/GDSL hydrolase family protein n=1 Tax=Robertmurraya sp. DFI.2.37 TaxID=3031819 RepID=UPI0012491940|nr:SGNH/GDSL hydrolase family protein [Robertmurraya sp. DFI.2.37]MDF1509861.1 SGNH/GDSL hydrolase family protein [Robertmurraya sp. DFI.2.37]